MAITADYTTYTYADHATNTITLTVTDSEGNETTETVPEQVESSSTVNGKYIIITNYNFYKEVVDGNGNALFDIFFKVYDSAADKNSDPNSHIAQGEILGQHHNITSSTDLRAKGYEILKADRRFSNITDS